MLPPRGEVWSVAFDPQVGAEIQKNRPAVVMTAAGIGRLPVAIVVPITDWKPHYQNWPWFVYLAPTRTNGLTKGSGADAFQVKSLSEQRFIRKLGVLTPAQLDEIAAAVALSVGYAP